MRVQFVQIGNLQLSVGGKGNIAYRHAAGEMADLPDDVARYFLTRGIAQEMTVKPERATAPAVRTADEAEKPKRSRKEKTDATKRE